MKPALTYQTSTKCLLHMSLCQNLFRRRNHADFEDMTAFLQWNVCKAIDACCRPPNLIS